MRLGIDARLYNQTGVGVYIQNLLFHFKHLIPKDWKVFVYVYENINLPISKKWKIRKVKARWHSLAEQTSFLKELLKDRLDLMHFTYFSFPILYPRPFVITIHDLTPLKFKTGKASTKSKIVYEAKHFFYRMVLKAAVLRAKGIIVPSKQVKREVIKFGAKGRKVKVIYEGIDEELKKIEEKPVDIKKPYFLYVGNFYPHKNVEFAIEGFLEFVEKFSEKDFYFYLVGPDDFFAKRLKKKYENVIGEKIIFLHRISRQELKFLYKKAKALIHPSLAEGFGLTLLEAFYFNTPVLASNLEVFKEIYGDLPLYFDPRSKEDFVEKLNLISKRLKKKRNFRKEVEKYNFLKTAKETMRLYEFSIMK